MRWLSARNARGIERGESSGLCGRCRYPNLRAVTEEEATRLARWWLDRFTDDEVADLALAFGVEERLRGERPREPGRGCEWASFVSRHAHNAVRLTRGHSEATMTEA